MNKSTAITNTINEIITFIKLKQLGLIKPVVSICTIDILSLLIIFIDNIEIFDDEEKEKIIDLYNYLII